MVSAEEALSTRMLAADDGDEGAGYIQEEVGPKQDHSIEVDHQKGDNLEEEDRMLPCGNLDNDDPLLGGKEDGVDSDVRGAPTLDVSGMNEAEILPQEGDV